jgi:hypothetical protein
MRVSTGVHKTSTNVSFMDTMVEDRDVSPTAAGSTRLGTSTMGTGMGLTETAGTKTVGKWSCSVGVHRTYIVREALRLVLTPPISVCV